MIDGGGEASTLFLRFSPIIAILATVYLSAPPNEMARLSWLFTLPAGAGDVL